MTEDVLEGLRAQSRARGGRRAALPRRDRPRQELLRRRRTSSREIQRGDGDFRPPPVLPNERSFAMYSPFLSVCSRVEAPRDRRAERPRDRRRARPRAGLRHPGREPRREVRRELHQARTSTRGMATTCFHAAPASGCRAPPSCCSPDRHSCPARRGGAARPGESRSRRRTGAAALARARARSPAPRRSRCAGPSRSLYQNVSWDPVSRRHARKLMRNRARSRPTTRGGRGALLGAALVFRAAAGEAARQTPPERPARGASARGRCRAQAVTR